MGALERVMAKYVPPPPKPLTQKQQAALRREEKRANQERIEREHELECQRWERERIAKRNDLIRKKSPQDMAEFIRLEGLDNIGKWRLREFSAWVRDSYVVLSAWRRYSRSKIGRRRHRKHRRETPYSSNITNLRDTIRDAYEWAEQGKKDLVSNWTLDSWGSKAGRCELAWSEGRRFYYFTFAERVKVYRCDIRRNGVAAADLRYDYYLQ